MKNKWFDEFGIKDKKIHPNGYWNCKEYCLKEATKYNSKTEFIKRTNGAYKAFVKNGWIKDLNTIFRTKQLIINKEINCL